MIKELREKPSERRTIGEILTLAMLSEPDSQQELGLELETKIREVIGDVVRGVHRNTNEISKTVIVL